MPLVIEELHAINVCIDLFISIYFNIYSLIGYFTCTQPGAFPDTAQCAIGRYFYCSQAFGGKFLKEISLNNRIILLLF